MVIKSGKWRIIILELALNTITFVREITIIILNSHYDDKNFNNA
jgi:hypothetical protein